MAGQHSLEFIASTLISTACVVLLEASDAAADTSDKVHLRRVAKDLRKVHAGATLAPPGRLRDGR